MKIKKTLLIISFSLLSICFLCNLAKMTIKKDSDKYDKVGSIAIFLAITLISTSQLIMETNNNMPVGFWENEIGKTPDLREGVTTIITTAPQPSIPSPHLIVNTVKSLSLIPLFQTSPVIIGFDGCKVTNPNLDVKCKSIFSCSKYNEYKKNVKREVLKIISHAVFVELPERGCLSSLLHRCMENVETDFVNVMQQDLPIVKKFEAKKVINAMRDNSDMDLVRYVYDKNKYHEDWTSNHCSKVLKPKTITIDDLQFTQCSQWSDTNHIAKMEHYKDIVWPNTKQFSFMEHEILCYPVKHNYRKIWYLGKISDGHYIKHTDGRNAVS